MSWRVFRKSRIRALESAVRKGKVDSHMVGLLMAISKSEKLAALSSCAGRIFLARWKTGKISPEKYYSIWHKADREGVEMALSRHGAGRFLWFAVEPFLLSVSAQDIESALSFMEKMGRKGVGCSLSKKQKRFDIEARGPFSMAFPVSPIEAQWNDIVDAANEVMDANLKLIKKLEKVKW